MSLFFKMAAFALAASAALSAQAVTIVEADFRTEADLPFCCARVGARVTSVLDAAVGAGVELQNQGLSNPSNWLGGSVWMDLDPTSNILTLTARDSLDYQTFTASLSNLLFDTPGAFINGFTLLSNGLTTLSTAPTLSFSAAGAQVNYSTTGIFNFVQGGTARFQLNVATLEGMADFPAVAPIPEPSTYALMIGGLALVAVAARRRRPSREL